MRRPLAVASKVRAATCEMSVPIDGVQRKPPVQGDRLYQTKLKNRDFSKAGSWILNQATLAAKQPLLKGRGDAARFKS